MTDFNKIGYVLAPTKDQDASTQALKLKKRGIKLIFFDDEVTWGNKPAFDRLEFSRLWAYRACNPGIKQIWVDELSRIGRSKAETDAVIKKLNGDGIELVVLSEPHCNNDKTKTGSSATDPSLREMITAVCSGIDENEQKRLNERNALSHGNEIGRIPCDIPRDYVESMRNRGLRWSEIARRLHCHETTLWRRRQSWRHQDGLTLTNQGQWGKPTRW